MGGYQALRTPDRERSTTATYDLPRRHPDEDDSPIVLARVADFRSKRTRPQDESRDWSCDDDADKLDDEFVDEAPASSAFSLAAVAEVVRSRMAIGVLVLVAGLLGFMLGRATSPDSPQEAQAYSPAPPASAAPEAPKWNSDSPTSDTTPWAAAPVLPKSTEVPIRDESPVRDASPAPAPWNPPAGGLPGLPGKSEEPAWSQTPPSEPSNLLGDRAMQQALPRDIPARPAEQPPQQPPQQPVPQRSADASQPSQWGNNQSMNLPSAQVEGRPVNRAAENPSPAFPQMASRPASGAPSVESGRYPVMNYPTTGYPADYFKTTPNGNTAPGGVMPANRTSSGGLLR